MPVASASFGHRSWRWGPIEVSVQDPRESAALCMRLLEGYSRRVERDVSRRWDEAIARENERRARRKLPPLGPQKMSELLDYIVSITPINHCAIQGWTSDYGYIGHGGAFFKWDLRYFRLGGVFKLSRLQWSVRWHR